MTEEQKEKLRQAYQRAHLDYQLTRGNLESALAKAKIDTIALIAEIFGVAL